MISRPGNRPVAARNGPLAFDGLTDRATDPGGKGFARSGESWSTSHQFFGRNYQTGGPYSAHFTGMDRKQQYRSPAPALVGKGMRRAMPQTNHEAAVAKFIRDRGITRCPTACVLPTQGSPAAADQAALAEYVMARDRLRQAKVAAHTKFWVGDVSSSVRK